MPIRTHKWDLETYRDKLENNLGLQEEKMRIHVDFESIVYLQFQSS